MGICATLSRDTERFTFSTEVKVEDLGLRLPDVEKYQLEPEPVSYPKKALQEGSCDRS
jgi:hypothetical protein